jgi:hypothetical protein
MAFRQCKSVSVLIASFRSSIPSPPVPLFTLRRTPRGVQRKTRGRAVRYSFLVGLFHSLLHAGLSRRTALAIWHQLTKLSWTQRQVFIKTRSGDTQESGPTRGRAFRAPSRLLLQLTLWLDLSTLKMPSNADRYVNVALQQQLPRGAWRHYGLVVLVPHENEPGTPDIRRMRVDENTSCS